MSCDGNDIDKPYLIIAGSLLDLSIRGCEGNIRAYNEIHMG